MELHHLRYFVAVAEAENFHKAAEHLKVAQPALSRQTRILERELGVELLQRLPRGTRLSEAGRAFLEDARRILDEVSQACLHAKRIARGQVGTLRMAFSPRSIWHGTMPESIRAFRAAQPDIELVLLPMGRWSAQQEALRMGQVDVGFAYEIYSDYDNRVFDRCRVQAENVILAHGRSHRLARRVSVSLRDLQDEPLICLSASANPRLHKQLMAQCLSGGLVPRIVQEVNTFETVLGLVSAGMGLGLVGSLTKWRQPKEVMLRPVKGLSLPLHLDLVWRRDNKSPVLAAFVQQVRELVKTEEPISAQDRLSQERRSKPKRART
jgi:DNA-binding transcriptional LysR family regulator